MQNPDRVDQVLDAANRAFLNYGPDKCTMQDIAKEAGLSVGSLYNVFTAKAHLIEELSRRAHLGLLQALTDVVTGPGPAEQKLTAFFDVRTAFFLRAGQQGMHAHDLVHCDHPAVQGAWERYGRDEAALLERVLAEGAFRLADAHTGAGLLIRLYSSFAPPHLRCEDPAAVRARLRDAHDVVLHGVVRPAPA